MKKILFFTSLFFISLVHSQTLEDKLESITTKIAKNLKKKKNYNIAVYPFTSLKSKESDLSLHIFGELHTALKAKEYNFSVMDRASLENYLAEHEWNSESLIDKKTAKQFGKLIAADAYASVKVYLFGSVINLTIKLTDTETEEIISYASEKMQIDNDMDQFLEIKNWEEKKEKANMNKSQNTNCASLNIRNYCFLNNTGISSEVSIKSTNNNNNRISKKLVLPINTKTCFKDLAAGSYTYTVYRLDRVNIAGQSNIISQGNFTVEKCSSQVQKIVDRPLSRISNGRILTSNSSKNLIALKIINPNFYSRKLIFYNHKNQSESIIISANSTNTIHLPKGIYKYQSITTFTNHILEKASINITKNNVIKLAKDHKN